MPHTRQGAGVRWANSFSVCEGKGSCKQQTKKAGKFSMRLRKEGKRDMSLGGERN